MDRSSLSRAAIALAMSANIVVLAVCTGRSHARGSDWATSTQRSMSRLAIAPDVKGSSKKLSRTTAKSSRAAMRLWRPWALKVEAWSSRTSARGHGFVYPIIRRQGREVGTRLRR